MNADNPGWDKMKGRLRSEIRNVLKNVSLEKRAAASAKIRGLLQQQLFWKSAASILFFAPLPDEVDV